MTILRLFLIGFVALNVSAWSVAAERNPLMPVKTDSPRDTMQTYLKAMVDYKKGLDTGDPDLKVRINDAVRCFDFRNDGLVTSADIKKETAVLLKEVIDRVIFVEYDKIPDDNDDERWRLKGTDIIIVKIAEGERAGEYLFSHSTVTRVHEFYEKVKHLPYMDGASGAGYKGPWLEEYAPEWAREKVLIMPNWQWISILIAILLGLVIKVIASYFLKAIEKLTSKSKNDWDDKIIDAIDKPFGLVAASIFWYFSIHAIQFEGKPLIVLTIIVQLVFSLAIVWGTYRLSDVLTDYLYTLTAKTKSPLDDQLVPLIRKALKIFIVVVGILVTFQNVGVNVLSVLAGLGLGGLAFALAAKDTCANLFGSVMIFLDRPFAAGDWIITPGVEGTVESIGFRSTKVRTFYNSLVSVPNLTMANACIDNMGRREYRRIKAFFGVTYDTPPEKMEAFLEGIKNIIKSHPDTRKDYYHVVFNSYGDFSLNIMLYCFLKVPDWSAELVERQNIYLAILRLAKDLEIDFAFPTQTLHMDSFPEKQTNMREHDVDREKLAELSGRYGAEETSMPNGMGLFVPPYKEDIPESK